jgi:glucosylceramidase
VVLPEFGFPASAIVIDTNTKKVTYTPMFRAFEHFSRYIPAGSKYADTKGSYDGAIAFVTPDGSIVVELLNESLRKRTITGCVDGKLYSVEMLPESFATLIIKK